jgi:hypothetical protein
MSIMSEPGEAASPKTPLRHLLVVFGVILLLVVAGIGLYYNERSSRVRPQVLYQPTGKDYVSVAVTLLKADPGVQSVTAKVTVSPAGALSGDANQDIPTVDLAVTTTSAEQTTLKYPAGQIIPTSTITFPLVDGRVSDYPFDRYQTFIGFDVTAGGKPVATATIVTDNDPFFVHRVTQRETDGRMRVVTVRVTRTRSTFILAWFMALAMWALTVSCIVAAWLITSQRRGLIWPALGWMAATLFALVGMRNAAPGNPPIGCLLDYGAFFWAEALTTVSLAVVVIRGTAVEREKGA